MSLMVCDHARVQSAVMHAKDPLAHFIDALIPRMHDGGRLVYLGAGTSGRLGVLDAAECPPTFQSDPQQVIGIIAGGDVSLKQSSEAKEDDPHGAIAALNELALTSQDTVLGIAAGGTTPYVLGGLAHARSCGTLTGLLCCAQPGNGSASVDHIIVLETGPELLTGSTRLKAGSATKLALNIITTTTFTKLGKVYSNLMVDLRPTNAKLQDRAIRVLMELCPTLMREAAADAIAEAGDLKTAIVMHRLGVHRAHAAELLKSHSGRLHEVIDHHDDV